MTNYETFLQRYKDKDDSWLKDKKNKSHINNVIKDNPLTTPQIKWALNNLRFKHIIIKKQILNENIIRYFLKLYIQNISKHSTDMVYIMKYQKLSDKFIKDLYENSVEDMYFEMWINIPKDMIRLGYLKSFYTKLAIGNNPTESIISIIKADNTTFIPILTILVDRGPIYRASITYKTLVSLSNALFWDDDTLDQYEKLISTKFPAVFADLTRNLVARGNCSTRKQAKYLLLK